MTAARQNIYFILTTVFCVAFPFLRLFTRSVPSWFPHFVSAPAHFDIPAPFVFRFLLPWLLSLVFPDSVLDDNMTIVLFDLLSVAACFGLFPAFWARLGGAPERLPVAGLALVVTMSVHFLGWPPNVWYAYDIPGVAFYMAAFLLLASKQTATFSAGLLLLVVASLNRETIVAAALHAGGVAIAEAGGIRAIRRILNRLLPLAGGVAAVAALKMAVVHSLGASVSDVASTSYDGQLRLLYNLELITRTPKALFLLPLFGAGILLWLPFSWKTVPSAERWMLAASIPFLAALAVAGNIVELRIYGEMTPLFAVLLARVLILWKNHLTFPPRPDDAAQTKTKGRRFPSGP